ncbi:MAG: SPOR domain-containing protein [Desulfobacterales bacterium]
MSILLRKNPSTRQNGSAFGRLVLLFVISACMFILGVLVGRNTAPVHFDMKSLESKLSGLETSVLADDNGGQTEEKQSPYDISFEFYDKLKEKTEIDEYAAGRPRVLAPKYEKPEPSEIMPLRAAAEKEEEIGPSSEIRPVKHTESQEKKYAIQVASLRDPEKAKQVREKFSRKGYPAFTKMAVVEEKGRWYRVRLGPYPDRKRARDDLNRLQKAGVDAIIVLND